MFVDEFGFSFAERLATTWAPQGKTPVVKRVGKFRREPSTLAGLTLSGKLFKRPFDGSINSDKVIRGVEHLRRWLGDAFILIGDGSGAHRSKRTQR